MFMILWSCYMHFAGRELDLPTAVVYVTLLPLTSLPVLLWVARKELRPAAPWAILMSGTATVLTPVGVYVLLVRVVVCNVEHPLLSPLLPACSYPQWR